MERTEGMEMTGVQIGSVRFLSWSVAVELEDP